MKQLIFFVAITVFISLMWTLPVQAQEPFEYFAPRPDAELVSTGTTIAVRQGDDIAVDSITSDLFTVEGSQSGAITGTVILADDQKTVIFQPSQQFQTNETVTVTISAGLQTTSGESIGGTSYSFQTSLLPPLLQQTLARDFQQQRYAKTNITNRQAFSETISQYATLPTDFPAITITTPASDAVAEGLLFMNTLSLPFPDYGYALIFDDTGEPIYYDRTPYLTVDFKKQANGNLSYCRFNLLNFNLEDGECFQFDDSYQLVERIQAGNGYVIDLHGMQINEAGHKLIQIYDPQQVDMSQVVAGGVPTATVTGSIIQELDPSNNVIFEWRSWDDIPYSDINDNIDLTADNIDATHINSIEWALDGNIIASHRNLDEATKINRNTAQIMWRMGGKANQFTFVNTEGDDFPPFNHQHDVRQLPNGNLTIYDNGNDKQPPFSRAVEYQLDEENLVITKVWEYRYQPEDIYAGATGNMQRLPNGNTLIGWGGATQQGNLPVATEVSPDGKTLFEMEYAIRNSSYRVFRQTWTATPAHSPTLVLRDNTLHYSWNGATDVSAYQVYQGETTSPDTLLTTTVASGFETTTALTTPPVDCTFYRVRPLDGAGNETLYSNVVFAGSECNRIATLTLTSTVQQSFTDTTNAVLLTTTLTVPTGAVSQTTHLLYTEIATPTQAAPSDLFSTGIAFDLSPQIGGVLVEPFTFNRPVSLTVQYADLELDESTLQVYFWDETSQMWSTEGIGVASRDAATNQLTFTTTHLTEFALFGNYETVNVVTDGGFEQTPSAWQEESSNGNFILCDGGCSYDGIPQSYRGQRWAQFSGNQSQTELGSLSQSLSLPTGEIRSATLDFRLRVRQSSGTPQDTFRVKLGETVVFSGTDALGYNTYTLVSVDVTDTLTNTLTLEAEFVAGSFTIFDVDQVNLTVQGIFLAPEPKVYLPYIVK